MIGVMVPSVFADHAEVAIVTVDESGFSQDCVDEGCYVPLTATVDVGGVVTMTNSDPVGIHTFTSGTVDGFAPDPDGTFDSDVLVSGDVFEWSPTESGRVPYFCMLHTWMVGEIIVIDDVESNNLSELNMNLENTETQKEFKTSRGTIILDKSKYIQKSPESNVYMNVGAFISRGQEGKLQWDCHTVSNNRIEQGTGCKVILPNKIIVKNFNENTPIFYQTELLQQIGYYDSSKSMFKFSSNTENGNFFKGNIELESPSPGKYFLYLDNESVGDCTYTTCNNHVPDSKLIEFDIELDKDYVPKPILSFVDQNKDSNHYVERYITEPTYKEWFDENFPDYTIWEGIGISQFQYIQIITELEKIKSEPVFTPEPVMEQEVNCGEGTESVNGICKIIQTEEKSAKGGGCLIATATYGSELAPQVQQLRELRDNQLLQTESGTAFIGMFNDIYYSFSPIIADYERENPYFKEAVKLAITPMISTLSLMDNAESESEVLSIGISVIMLNLGMYLGVPAVVIVGIRKRF